jgi:hypothetical protein
MYSILYKPFPSPESWLLLPQAAQEQIDTPGAPEFTEQFVENWPVPIRHASNIQQQEWWDYHVMKYGIDSLKPYPQIMGLRITLHDTYRTDCMIPGRDYNELHAIFKSGSDAKLVQGGVAHTGVQMKVREQARTLASNFFGVEEQHYVKVEKALGRKHVRVLFQEF